LKNGSTIKEKAGQALCALAHTWAYKGLARGKTEAGGGNKKAAISGFFKQISAGCQNI